MDAHPGDMGDVADVDDFQARSKRSVGFHALGSTLPEVATCE